MKVAWFTPWWSHSAIAAFSQHVTEWLSQFAEIELWVPEQSDERSTRLPVNVFDPDNLPTTVFDVDIAVYCIGNNYAFHDSVMRVAERIPGVVILHDTVMHHAYLDQARLGERTLDGYLGMLTRWYGSDVAGLALEHLGADPFAGYPPDAFCAQYSLLEEATRGALGVVVHASAQAQRLQPYEFIPLWRLNLPGYKTEVFSLPPAAPEPNDAIRLLSIGWVGRPKQIHLVLDALIARPSLCERIQYKIAGPMDVQSEYGQELLRRLDDHALRDSVEFLGYVSDGDLARWTAWADAFVNLRWPSTEGGSASLVHQLVTGKPVVVSSSGIFGELPDHAVLRIVDHDPSAVADALERLQDPALRTSVGAAGQAVASGFTVAAYGRGMLTLIEEAVRWRVPVRLVDRVGDELARLGAREGMGALLTIGAELSELFGRAYSEGRPMAL